MNDIGISTRKPDPLTRARALGPAIAAVVDEIERIQAFPEPLLTKLHESRLFRLLLPRSVGGEQVEPWVYLAADRGDRTPRRLARLEHVRRQQLGPDRALHPHRSGAPDLFGSARPDLLGAAQPAQGGGGARRLPHHRRMAFLVGLPPGQLDRRARPCRRARRLAAAEPPRPADRPHAADAQGQDDADPRLEHARHARHGIGRLCLQGRVRAGGILRHARGSEPAPRYRAALCLHHPGSLCHGRRQPWRWGWRAPCSMPSSSSRWRRRRATWGGWPTARWCSPTSPAARPISVQRAPSWSRS